MKKGEKTRGKLLKCAEKVFSQKGYYETQVSDIVKMGGVAKGTIYQYFKNKRDIFSTLLEQYIRDWENAVALDMKDYMGDRPGIEYAIDFLRHRLQKTAFFFSENQDRTNIILRIGIGVNEEFEPIMRKFEGKILRVIMHDIVLGQKQGHIPQNINLEMASNAVIGAIFRINYYLFVINKRTISKIDINSLVEEGVRLMSNTLQMK
ncbi:MAG: hypothetical protein A2176_03385 [Spirochaetes bacterium RBG_13_51_14]|nr:MAG: hypothetical protein A2176_03385 [Spirochaetes bacterium RBG_13_51_14]